MYQKVKSRIAAAAAAFNDTGAIEGHGVVFIPLPVNSVAAFTVILAAGADTVHHSMTGGNHFLSNDHFAADRTVAALGQTIGSAGSSNRLVRNRHMVLGDQGIACPGLIGCIISGTCGPATLAAIIIPGHIPETGHGTSCHNILVCDTAGCSAGKMHFFHTGIPECTVIKLCSACRDGDGRYVRTCKCLESEIATVSQIQILYRTGIKRALIYTAAITEVNICQTAAAAECIIIDPGNAVRDRYGCNCRTVKGTVANLRQPLRQQYAGNLALVVIPGSIIILIAVHFSRAGDGQRAGCLVKDPGQIVAAGAFIGRSCILGFLRSILQLRLFFHSRLCGFGCGLCGFFRYGFFGGFRFGFCCLRCGCFGFFRCFRHRLCSFFLHLQGNFLRRNRCRDIACHQSKAKDQTEHPFYSCHYDLLQYTKSIKFGHTYVLYCYDSIKKYGCKFA